MKLQIMPNAIRTQPHPIDALVYDGINILDVAGPMQAFWTAERYKLRVLSADGEPVESQPGLKITGDGAIKDWNTAADLLIPVGAVDSAPGASKFAPVLQDTAQRTNNTRLASIKQAAHLSGSGHIQNLRRAFQQNFGISPSDYVKRFSHAPCATSTKQTN